MKEGKICFQVRIDSDLHKSLKQTACDTNLSLNQLVTGLLRGSVDNLRLLIEKAGDDCDFKPSDIERLKDVCREQENEG